MHMGKLISWVMACLFLGGGMGCTTIVRAPEQVKDPQRVYLVDHVTFSSVLLPVDEKRFVEYRTGDWDYAALEQQGPYHTFQAMFWSPQAAMGRRFLQFEPAPMLPEALNMSFLTVIPIDVERKDLAALIKKLDARFKAGALHHYNSSNGFEYATMDEHYSMINNCNAFTQNELRDLRCVVIRRSIFSGYDVSPQAKPLAGPPVPVEDR
jgi:hypothetical protein